MKKIFIILFLFPAFAIAQQKINSTQVKIDGETVIGNASKELSVDTTNTIATKDWVENNTSSGGGVWGSITGTLSDQTDLQSALNAKQNTITTGTTLQYFRGDLSLATFPTGLITAGDTSSMLSNYQRKGINTLKLWGRTTAGYGNIEEITIGSGLSFSSLDLSVDPNTTNQKVQVATNDNTQGTRHRLNFLTTPTIDFDVSDDAVDDELEISAAFASMNVSQFTNDAGYITSLTGYVKRDGSLSFTGQETFEAGLKTNAITDNGENIDIYQSTSGRELSLGTLDQNININAGGSLLINASGGIDNIANGNFTVQSISNIYFLVSPTTNEVALGDFNNNNNGTSFIINDDNQTISLKGAPGSGLLIGSSQTVIGDGLNLQNGTVILTDDGAEEILLSAGSGVGINNYRMPLADGSADQFLKTDGAGLLSFADITAGDVSGLGTAATQNSTSFLQVANNLSDLANASTARTNLGVAIGTHVQAFDADLTTYAGITPSTVVQNILSLSNPSAVRFLKANADNTVSWRSASELKTDLSLDNVENTALSTWAGSSNITTVGTITSGEAMQESAESSSTANSAAANDTPQPAAAARFYNFFTLPSTGKLYYITGIEWKNGTVVSGNVICGIDIVDASPPVGVTVFNQAFTVSTTQTGTSAVQRVSQFERCIFRGGDLLAAWVQFDNTSSRRMTSTVASSNMRKNVTFTTSIARADGTSWVAATEQPYLKIYYREYK